MTRELWLLAAGRADHPVAVDQDRLAVAHAVALLAAEVLRQALAPALLAVGPQADQLAVGRQGVDAVAVHRRRRA
jgi:hypothetical protein